ncbi:hypothetical protein LUQ84_002523 [Hamiltosporidium tvaerminnensis]|nr:hypothetical protein LUQ84_002523 [Hamiltosporidium tvaerminnensis]
MLKILFYLLQIVCSKENAVILVLCRNSDLKGIKKTIINFEDTFNKQYNYPYVFLNDKVFTEEFKNGIKEVTSSLVEFGQISSKDWNPPPWIDMEKVKYGIEKMKKTNVPYADSLSYRNMCRFFSGFFYRHPLVQKYDFYWRLEPGVTYYCYLDFDPFKFMREKNKLYGFVITMVDFLESIPTLWQTTSEYLHFYENYLPNIFIESFIFDENLNYNGCHFWSNFEIASFQMYRNTTYQTYFDWLDRSGGFYYERWGDAPVHSLAACLFLGRDKIHFFNNIGYKHGSFIHCPPQEIHSYRCTCKPEKSMSFKMDYSCLKNYLYEIKYLS